MKSVCLYLKIHQPFRLKRYRFFDIGNDHYYFDDFANDEIVSRVAAQSYIPTAHTLLEMVNNPNYDFRCAIAISGTAIEQLQMYVPEFIELLRKLAATGKVEFLAGTYSHGLSSLEDAEEFMRQVSLHRNLIKREFGQDSKIISNTELIFDDDIALLLQEMGFKAAVTEGAKHILGWKSPNFIYRSAVAPKLELLLVNDKLTDDIALNFNNHNWHEYPLTADKYVDWIASLPEDQKVVNLFLSMETFGTFLPKDTGIFDFLKALPIFAKERDIQFTTPSDAIAGMRSVGELAIPYPLSGTDEARDVSAWKGNTMQREALDKLYSVAERVNLCSDRRLKQEWLYLQSSDHFYYMSTKRQADGASHALFSPYDSPFAAFINYMNVLADFMVRVREQFPEAIDNEELNSLLLTIRNQAAEIEQLKKNVGSLRNNILHDEDNTTSESTALLPAENKPSIGKPAAKPAAKPIDKPADKPIDKPAANPRKKAAEKSASKPAKAKKTTKKPAK